jgi:hypothetical protein
MSKRSEIIVISVLFSIFAIYNYWWLSKNSLPPSPDEAWHLMSSLYYYRIIVHFLNYPSWDIVGMIEKLVNVEWYYPPFFKFSTAFLYMIFGTSIKVAILTNTIYLGILLFSTYGIGKILFDNDNDNDNDNSGRIGVLAAILVSMYPTIFGLQHYYLIDLSLIAMVTLSIYLLLCTRNFTSIRYSLIFGVILGLTLLVKWTAIFFIIGPIGCIAVYIIYLLFFELTENRRQFEVINKQIEVTRRQIIYLTFSIFVAIFIASIWYIPNGLTAFNFVEEMSPGWASVAGQELGRFSFDNLSYYIGIIPEQISSLFTIVFLIGMTYLIGNRQKSRQDNLQCYFLLSWILIPILILTMQINKSTRYSAPILPAIAIISAYGLYKLIYKLMSLSGSSNSSSNEIGKKVNVRLICIVIVILLGGIQIIGMASDNLPKQENWKIEEILSFINNDMINKNTKETGYIVVVADTGFITGRAFEYYSFKMDLPFQIYNGAYIGDQMFKEQFLNFDYLIFKSGTNNGPYRDVIDNETAYFKERNERNKYGNDEYNNSHFILIKELSMPDNSIVSIYRNRYLN